MWIEWEGTLWLIGSLPSLWYLGVKAQGHIFSTPDRHDAVSSVIAPPSLIALSQSFAPETRDYLTFSQHRAKKWCLPHRLSDISQYLSLPPLTNFCIHQSIQHSHCLCLSADPHQLSLGLFHCPHLWSSFYGVLNTPVACISISVAWLGRFPTPCFSQCWLS